MPAPNSRFKAVAFRLFTLGVGCVIALLLLEGMLRIYNPFGARIRGSHIVLAKNRRYVFSKFPEYSAGTCSRQTPNFATSKTQSGVNN